MRKKRRNPKQIRIVIVLVLISILVCFFCYKFKDGDDAEVFSSWDENLSSTTNYVEEMNWTDTGIEVEGIMKNNNGVFYLKICRPFNKDCIGFSAEVTKKGTFRGELDLTNLENGVYEVFVESEREEKLTDNRSTIERIVRKRMNDKLITLDYSNDRVKLTVANFKYEYDILIDPGHGGEDSGSYNKYIDERKLNLEQSLYEKKRYEEHGLVVKMLRDDYSYGIMMGDDNWIAVRKRAYAIGYYGVVSRISYSNHHNSSEVKSYSGWEIIVPNRIGSDALKPELEVANDFEDNYQVREKHIRFYTRNGDNGELYSKRNNEIYNFIDYYAVIRIPYELFGVKNILYEGCYLSNLLDYDWYYTKGNWKEMSEYKIKAYVESLGKKYIPPKS